MNTAPSLQSLGAGEAQPLVTIYLLVTTEHGTVQFFRQPLCPRLCSFIPFQYSRFKTPHSRLCRTWHGTPVREQQQMNYEQKLSFTVSFKPASLHDHRGLFIIVCGRQKVRSCLMLSLLSCRKGKAESLQRQEVLPTLSTLCSIPHLALQA